MIGKLLKHRFTYQFVNNSKRIMNDNTQSKLFEKESLLGFTFWISNIRFQVNKYIFTFVNTCKWGNKTKTLS